VVICQFIGIINSLSTVHWLLAFQRLIRVIIREYVTLFNMSGNTVVTSAAAPLFTPLLPLSRLFRKLWIRNI
jgi:hypothetical protein